MLIPKKSRHAIYSYLFNEGVLCAKKDFNAPKHHTIEVPNLFVIKAMQSLKSRGFVTEKFCWQWYFWYLTNPGINHLRDYLHLSDDVVPATVKATTTKKTSEPRGFGEGRYDREGYRGGGRGRFGDREGYRGDRPGFDEKKTGPPGEGFQPSFREGGGRGRGFGGYRGGDREGGYRGGDREGGGYRGGDREGGGYRGGDREGGGYGGEGGYRGGEGGDREGGYRGGDREGGYRAGGDREGGYRGGDREGGGYRGGDREGGGYRGGDRGEGGYGGRGGYRGGEGGDRGGYQRDYGRSNDQGGFNERGFSGRGRARAEGSEYRRTEGGAGFPSGGRGAPPPRT